MTRLPTEDSAAILPELIEFLRIPSVSTLPEHKGDVQRAAEWVADYLRRAGLDHVAVIPTAGHPLVYADWLHAADQPTVLIYGHYDVQPADPLAAWHSPPFEPTVRDGNIYARGAADDKGQVYIHLRAVAGLLAEGGLPVNVRFLIEGEEEVGSAGLTAYIQANPTAPACDAVLISDTPMFAPGRPTITTGLRGAVFTELTVETGRQDVHSGLYGGAAPNAIGILCGIIAGLTDAAGRVTLPGYYDAVRSLTAAERESWAALPFDAEAYREAEIGAPTLLPDAEFSILERVWGRPTFDVNGIEGGYSGAGSKAIIPARAQAKLSFRLVPDQDPTAVIAALRAHVAELCPPSATVHWGETHGAPAVLLATDSPAMQAARAALAETFGCEPVLTRMGGSVPIVLLFQMVLHAPCIMLGFGLPDDNLHAPNEKMHLANITDGILAVRAFLRRLAH